MIKLLQEALPFWSQLDETQKSNLLQAAGRYFVKKGTLIHNGAADCVGLILIENGQLRAFIDSEEGREITLYRLLERDICLFSASCMINSLQFDILVEAEMDTTYLLIPTAVIRKLSQQSVSVSNYLNELMASRFTDVMWLLDQVLYKRLDSRLAAFLIEESSLTGTETLQMTHEAIAKHLGSAREVITKMLRYFQAETLISLSRGAISITDRRYLEQIASESLR